MTMNKIYSWQHKLWNKLTHHADSGANALLLKGRAGIGKLDFARHFAKFRLCETPSSTSEACGTCLSCGWFEKGGHPDFYHVSPETSANFSGEAAVAVDRDESAGRIKSKKKTSQQISIVQIRALSDFVYMTGHQRGRRIILICPAEAMNAAAANALLKKLEEPPAHVLFILVAHRPQQLPATIRSRCQLINMPMPDVVQATRWLKQQGVNEPEACLAAASFAPLLALTFNDQRYAAQHDAFIEQISASRKINPIELAEKMQQSDLPIVVSWMQKWCYDLLCFCLTGKVRYHLSRMTTIRVLASSIENKALAAFLRTLLVSQQLARHPLNPRLFLEEIFIKYATLLDSNGVKRSS
ncbi:MAG: DNA polymerase III subunit delta' [Nitrosomonas sp.]|nr:MAG: DNA polymerase III subunit delta' [Nitrosomonas sp.]